MAVTRGVAATRKLERAVEDRLCDHPPTESQQPRIVVRQPARAALAPRVKPVLTRTRVVRQDRPPRAADGIVPKNARGNVDLIGAHALPPPGTAHVSLPRIARVARALRDAEKADGAERPFDFAPALVGFEYRRGGATLPKFDGTVVCVEREACLRDAWRDFETARVAREREKDAARAKRRWRVLLSAVWTRRSLRDEFLETDEPARARDGGGDGLRHSHGLRHGRDGLRHSYRLRHSHGCRSNRRWRSSGRRRLHLELHPLRDARGHLNLHNLAAHVDRHHAARLDAGRHRDVDHRHLDGLLLAKNTPETKRSRRGRAVLPSLPS